MSSTIGFDLARAMLHAPVDEVLTVDLTDSWLREPEQEVIHWIWHHVRKYKKLPAESTIKKEFPDLDLTAPEETPDFYIDKIKERFIYEGIVTGVAKAKAHLDKKKGDFDPGYALQVLSEAVGNLRFSGSSNDLVDLREAHDMLYGEYLKRVKGYEGALPLGWPSLDEMSGGVGPGDVISLIGRPGKGKSYTALFSAHHVWNVMKRPVLFVSMEMPTLECHQRLASIHTGINPGHIKKGELTTYAKKKVFGQLKELRDGDHPPLWVVDGNLTTSTEDIGNMIASLNPGIVYVDGAYMLQCEGSHRMSKWERISRNAEFLKKDIARGQNIPLFNTYQFNRDAAKKMKKHPEDIGLEDISGADEIGQLSSVVLGMLQEETVETLTRKMISILKGRSGEAGRFHINWQFSPMDLSEQDPESYKNKQLQFLS